MAGIVRYVDQSLTRLMLSRIKRAIVLAPGWRTLQKLLVIQSDDWFAIRTSGAEALRRLKDLGVQCERCHYMQNDHFERGEDLSALFETLHSVRDTAGRPAVITANCLSANPDFTRIEQSGFTEYHAEASMDTAAHIYGAEDNPEIWRQAIDSNICEPQSHGREHLHIQRWLRALQSNNEQITRTAFADRMFGVSGHVVPDRRESFLAALDTTLEPSPADPEPILVEALAGFQAMFGFSSRSFIAPNYVWAESVEEILHRHGVEYIQSGRVQWYPSADGSRRCRRRRFLGNSNRLGQRYLVRNVDFEPASNPSIDWIDLALGEIRLAFRLRKPAIISTHRVNFMGGLDPGNRDRGLRDLQELLRAVVRYWPEVEFISTTELGDRIRGKQNP